MTGERVIGFMSGNQQSPDVMSEAFILVPSDLIDQAELPASPLRAPSQQPARRSDA